MYSAYVRVFTWNAQIAYKRTRRSQVDLPKTTTVSTLARSFRKLKENSVRAMKPNYEAMTTSELSLKANVVHMSTTNSVIVSYCCHWDPKTEVNTLILYSDKTDTSLDALSQQFVQDSITRIKEVITEIPFCSKPYCSLSECSRERLVKVKGGHKDYAAPSPTHHMLRCATPNELCTLIPKLSN